MLLQNVCDLQLCRKRQRSRQTKPANTYGILRGNKRGALLEDYCVLGILAVNV